MIGEPRTYWCGASFLLSQFLVEILLPMIESPLRLFEVQVERVLGYAVELLKPSLRKAPEALDPIDVIRTPRELVLIMLHPVVLCIADIDQPLVADERIGVEYALQVNTTLNDLLQGLTPDVRDDLCVDFALPLEQTEDDDFSSCTAAPTPWDPSGSEVALIELDLATQRRTGLTCLCDANSEFVIEYLRCPEAQTRHLSRLGRS